MYDIRNIIFPMEAGDLVQSAVILGQQKRGDGAELHLFEVMDVRHPHDDIDLIISLRDKVTYDRFDITLHPETPLLITDIKRS